MDFFYLATTSARDLSRLLSIMPIGAFDFKRICLLSYRSRSTLMSYTDHSVQRCLKSNAPNESAQWTHISTSAIQVWWHTPPFHYKHQDGGEKIWLHQGTNYSVHEHLVLTTDTKVIPQFMHNHVNQILRDSASSCHVCWDAVFCTYFVVIECVDWNKIVWIKVLFLENYFIFLICCIWAGQGCTLVTHETNAQHYVSFVSLHHFHHVWCACRSQEEFTDSDVSCRVTSRHKHFLISLQIFLL